MLKKPIASGRSNAPDGALNSAGYAVSGQSSLDFTNAGRLKDIAHVAGDGATISSYAYAQDLKGRITSMTTLAEGVKSFTYDANGQILAGGTESYGYQDNSGTRTAFTLQSGSANRVADDGNFTYQYDGEGNVVRKTSKLDSSYTTYTWDHRNRLTCVETRASGGVLTSRVGYAYDVNDLCIGRQVDSDGNGTVDSTERYVSDGKNIVMVFDGANTLIQRFLQGSGMDHPLAEERISAPGQAGQVVWLLADHEGSVRDAVTIDPTTHAVTATWHAVYDSFGNVTSTTGALSAPRFTYTAREYDNSTGLYYYRARWYDASTGRFMSQDPLGLAAGDTNLYRYVGNDPANAADPTGMEELNWFGNHYKDMPLWLRSNREFVGRQINDQANDYAEHVKKHNRVSGKCRGGNILGESAGVVRRRQAAVRHGVRLGSWPVAWLYQGDCVWQKRRGYGSPSARSFRERCEDSGQDARDTHGLEAPCHFKRNRPGGDLAPLVSPMPEARCRARINLARGQF